MRISTCVRFTGGPTSPATPKEEPNPGDEIVAHLVACLPRAGIAVRKVADIEYAHEIECEVSGKTYKVLVGFDWITQRWWEVFYRPRLSWVSRLLGRSEFDEMRSLTRALAVAIGELPGLSEARWYTSYNVRVSGRYALSPEA
jgi:hypothetical protein